MRVGVLRGGNAEYETSLASGEAVLRILREKPQEYEPLDIYISKDGVWHMRGVPSDPHRILAHVDTAINALHGEYGESGEVQRLLTSFHIPYTGSQALGAALSLHSKMARERLRSEGFEVPRYTTVDEETNLDDVRFIFRNYMHPVVVAPVRGGRIFGRRIASSFDELMQALADAFTYSPRVMVEEAVRGKEVYCGVVEGLRGEKLYALMPSPQLSTSENKAVETLARRAHHALGLRHYSLSHFGVTTKGKIYILGTRALPELHAKSPFMQSLECTGLSPEECIEHLVKLSLQS